MLLTKEILVKVTENKIKFYNKHLNSNFKLNDVILVPIKLLSKSSFEYVDVKCDICYEVKSIRYVTYNLQLKNKSQGCTSCKGTKIKETMMDRYGYFNNNRNKSKETCIEKYGVDNVSKSELVKDIKKETNMKNWGVDNVFKSDIIKDIIKEIHLENFGVDHPSKSDIIKDKKVRTCNINFGVNFPTQSNLVISKRNINNIEKYGYNSYTKTDEYKTRVKNTNLIKYGSEWYMSTDDFKEKSKITNNEKYGEDHHMQNIEVFQRNQVAGFSAKNYNGLYYRGSYELDFIKFCEINNIIIENGSSIKFIFNDKNKIYFPDFYVPSLNLICEIKSDYYYSKDLELNLAKKEATLSQGYNFLFIIDKNYKELLDII
jgi:hypothetical protein